MAMTTTSSIFTHEQILNGSMQTWFGTQNFEDVAAVIPIPVGSGKVMISVVHGKGLSVRSTPRNLALKDGAGSLLTAANTMAKNPGLYKQVAPANTAIYFTLDFSGADIFDLCTIRMSANNSSTLTTFRAVLEQFYDDDGWKENLTYELSLSGTDAKDSREIYPSREVVYGMPSRIKVLCNAETTVYMQGTVE